MLKAFTLPASSPITISIEVDYATIGETGVPNPTLVSDITAITKASPGQVTATAHGFVTGRTVVLMDIEGMTELNGQHVTVTVINANTYTIGVDTSGYGTYTTGGICYRLPTFDGADAFDGCAVLLPLQLHDEIENGVYVWSEADNTLTRHPLMFTGATITSPYYVGVRDQPVDESGTEFDPGDDNAGAIFSLEQTAFIVGTDVNTWAAAEGAGVYGPNYILGGPGIPSARPNISRPRVMYGADLPQIGMTGADTGYIRQSAPLIMIRAPRISTYVRHSEPWSDLTAFEYLQQNHKEFVVDCMLQFRAGPDFYDGRRIIFEGTGFGGTVRVLSLTRNLKVFDVSGTTDLTLDGHLAGEELIPHSTAVTPLIYANASFTNLRLGKVWSKGFSHAVYFDTAHGGFNIEEVNVNDTATEAGFAATSATGSQYSTLLRNLSVPTFQTIATDAAATIKAESSSDIIEHTGTLTVDRTLTLSTENVTRDKRIIIQRNGVDLFGLAVGGLTSLRTGDKAEIGWDGVAGAWKLVRKTPLFDSGTFVPTFAFATPGNSSFVIANAVAYWQRFNNAMQVDLQMVVTPTIGTGSGVIQIGELPITAAASYGGSVVTSDADFTWPAGATELLPIANGTKINLRGLGSTINSVAFQASNMTDGNAHNIVLSLRYRIA